MRLPITRHQSLSRKVTADAYPLLDGGGKLFYVLRLRAGNGNGGPNEPVVSAEFTARELRDFAVDLLSLVAVEESRV